MEGACRQVRTQLRQLEAVGFLPVLTGPGKAEAPSFQRVGEVRAERLTDGRTWRNSYGDPLSAAAGDWLVVDEFGNERTVRDEEFRASHEPLDGDRWLRTGVVRAWQVDETTVVHTLEGRAVAQPGDWIIQGGHGERWPVRNDQLELGYAPAGPGSGTAPGNA